MGLGFALLLLGFAPGFGLLPEQLLQFVVAGKIRFGVGNLPGQGVEGGGVSGMAFHLHAGGIPCGEQPGQFVLLCGKILPQFLCGRSPAKSLLHSRQPLVGFVPRVGGGREGGVLPFRQLHQQFCHRIGRSLGGEGGQSLRFRVILRPVDAGQDLPDLDVLRRPPLVQVAAFGQQLLLQLLIPLGAEQGAEDLDPLFGGGVEQPGELPLRDQDDLRKLVVVQPDHVDDGGSDLFRPGHGRAAVAVGEGGVGLFGGEALAAGLRAEVFGISADGVPLAAHLEFQLDKGGGLRVGVFAAEHGTLPDAAAGMVVQGVGDGVEEGGLARTGVAGDEIQPAPPQLFQLQHRLCSVRPEGREGQLQRSHASASFQIVSMSS